MKGTFKITFVMAILITIIILMYNVFTKKKNLIALTITTMFSILAPLSWFVLAASHTTIHNMFATINWFIPFAILFYAMLFSFTKEVFMKREHEILLEERGSDEQKG